MFSGKCRRGRAVRSIKWCGHYNDEARAIVMALFPNAPLPSSVSAPAVIDPMLIYQVDQGYSLRRPRTSRPRFRYTVDWLGKRTDDMHIIRTFLLSTRLGALSFSWQHPTASEAVAVTNTT